MQRRRVSCDELTAFDSRTVGHAFFTEQVRVSKRIASPRLAKAIVIKDIKKKARQ